MRAGLYALALPALVSLSPAPGESSSRGGDRSALRASESVTEVLRIAKSDDGLDFADTGEVFLQNSSAPDLIRLPNRTLLAIFDYRDGSGRGGERVLAVSRSTDEARSWSPPRPIILRGAPRGAARAEHGDLALMLSGLVRLYFKTGDSAPKPSHRRPTGLIGSAVTRNGLHYEIDRQVHLRCEGPADVHPSGAWFGSQLDLFVVGRNGPTPRSAGRPWRVQRFTSGDGRRFKPSPRIREAGSTGNILALGENRFRMFLSSGNAVRSMISGDGLRWRVEPGVRLRNASDPAVVQLRDGTFLMLYVAALENRSTGLPQKALALSGGDAVQGAGEESRLGHQPGPDALGGGDPSPGDDRPGDNGFSPNTPPDRSNWEPFTPAGFDSELGDGLDDAWGAQPTWGQQDPEDPFAPRPDFQDRIDYILWYEDNLLPSPGDNAYDAYAGLFGDPLDENAQLRPEWDLNDRLNGDEAVGPPAPWHPDDFPDWERSYQASQGLMDEFRAAAGDPRWFANPVIFPDDASDNAAVNERLLMGLNLPGLRTCRALSRAVLSQAWRTENGVVSPEGMREAWQTVLDNAGHLQQGATIIESLVGTAEQNLVHNEARWALRNNVFTSAEEMEAALRTLQSHDLPSDDPAHCLPGEHAMMMDAIQYLFEPTEAGGEPGLNVEKAAKLFGCLGTSETDLEDLTQLEVDDARDAIGAADSYFRELAEDWRVGYPDVRNADIDALGEEWYLTNALTRQLMPSLSRMYKLQARCEASRRATQLSYAVHLFKARNGRWPTSLDELPAEFGHRMRIDPFTGGDFGYRLTPDGPTVYSLSENGVDDGGVHSRRWDDEITNEAASDDYVFWPPCDY